MAGIKRIDLDEVKRRLSRYHNDEVKIIDESFTGWNEQAIFQDCDFGEWKSKPSIVAAGHHHPLRGKQNRDEKHKLLIDTVIERIQKIHGNEITLDASTYVQTNKRARFVDCDFGEWWTTPAIVMLGCKNPKRSQKTKLSKIAQSLRDFPSVVHWKTGEECVSQSSYEFAVLHWLCEKEYDFDWQIPFETSMRSKHGKVLLYTIDLLIKTGPFADQFIEIKGFWRSKLSKEKWEWFHQIHPNSQLWTREKLKEVGVEMKVQFE